jgi:hypothetical protein
MKVNKFLGSLIPTHPDLYPIVQQMRDKHNLPEISPDDDPITERILGISVLLTLDRLD